MRRYFPSLVILLASLAIPACSQAVTADPPEETVEMLFNSPAYGIHTNMWWKPDLIEQDLALVKEMEFDWVKQKFPWREIEGIEKGQYDWYRPDRIVEATEADGLNLLVRLDRQPFWSEPEDNLWHENQPPGNLRILLIFAVLSPSATRGALLPTRYGTNQTWAANGVNYLLIRPIIRKC